MARHANEARFGTTTQGGSWYAPPYPRVVVDGMWRPRAAWLHQQYPTAAQIAIAGCGFGHTLYWLHTDHARNPYGCDVQWAANIAAGIVPGGTSRIAAHDVLSSNAMTQFRRMGMSGQNRYPLLLTEDLLPAMDSEAEVATALTNLRAIALNVVHLITPLMTDTAQDPDMLWRTPAQWRSLIGPNERIVGPNLEDWP
jgi:hypothetical protein